MKYGIYFVSVFKPSLFNINSRQTHQNETEPILNVVTDLLFSLYGVNRAPLNKYQCSDMCTHLQYMVDIFCDLITESCMVDYISLLQIHINVVTVLFFL